MSLLIIYINSWPGVGKHTIANALKAQLGGQARVVCDLILGQPKLYHSRGTVLFNSLYLRCLQDTVVVDQLLTSHPVSLNSFKI